MKFRPTTENIISCMLYVLFGVLFCAFRTGMINVFMTIVGVLFIVFGIYNIVLRDYAKGIIQSVIGIVIIVCGWVIAKYVLLIFGILLIVEGVVDLIRIIREKRMTLAAVCADVVYVVVGILLCVAPFAIGDIICVIVGVIFIINGILALFEVSRS